MKAIINTKLVRLIKLIPLWMKKHTCKNIRYL